jgi:hypothetical protein
VTYVLKPKQVTPAVGRSEVLTAVLLKIKISWDVTLCRWVNSSVFLDYLTLKIKEI